MPFFLSVIIATINIGSLEYIIGKSTNYSMGVSAYICYAIGFAYMLLGIFMNVENSVVAELDNIHEEMIYSFADIVESRDGSTGEHIKRTTVQINVLQNAV